MQFIEKQVAFSDNADGLLITHTQEIPDEFLTDLHIRRTCSISTPEGEFMHVARIPEVVVDEWHRQGFDIYTASAQEIVARLKQNDLQKFLATEKRV